MDDDGELRDALWRVGRRPAARRGTARRGTARRGDAGGVDLWQQLQTEVLRRAARREAI